MLKKKFKYFFCRCEASNSANPSAPASTRVNFVVFFAPNSLTLTVERPERKAKRKEGETDQWDHADTFKRAGKFRGDREYQVVLAGEMVRIVCRAGER